MEQDLATKAKAAAIIKRIDTMKAHRHNWERHWLEVAEYILPKKDNIYGEKVEGEKKFNLLYDSTSIQSAETLAANLHGMMTNPATEWFSMSTGIMEMDSREDVRAYLQAVTRIILDMLNESNFQSQIHETYMDLAGFGTNLLRVLEDDTYTVRFESRPIYEAYIMENKSGVVDTVYYEYELTIAQIIQEFGDKWLTHEMKQKYKDQPMCKYKVLHAVEPRAQVQGRVKIPKNMPFASFHVLRDGNILLKESGFHENPNIVPRWSKIAGETYGRSPGMKALADIKMLNKVKKAHIEHMQLMVSPPLQVPDEGVLLPIKTSPNSVNYYRAGTKDRIEPLNVGGAPTINENFIAQIKEQIRQAFFIDQMQLVQNPRMTTMEVAHRRDEQLRTLGPLMGRLNHELLRPLIDRVFGIGLRANKFPEAPEVLRGMKVNVRYISQIAKAQLMSEVDNVTRAMQFLAPFFEAKPETMDNFTGDGLVSFATQSFNLPQVILTSKREKAKIRQAQLQEAETDNQLQQAGAASEIQKNVAQANVPTTDEDVEG